jgi:26S proteasome non-ATPase regulatory subunit 9
MAFPAPAEPSSTSLPLPDPEAYPGEPREYARALMQRKDEIEAEMVSHSKDI